MKNKFIAMLVGVFLIPIACRTETDYVDKEEARQPFAVFSTTSNNNVAYRKNSKTGSDQIDYASGFAYLLQRHDSIHHKNNTGLVNSTNETSWDDELKQHFIKKSSSAFIEFRIKSQTVVQENQDKWVVFPKIENDKVIDLVGVVLSDSETDVRYYYIDRESEFYKDNVSLFQEKYNKYFTKSNRTTANRDAADRDIDEVTLTHINRRPWWDTGKQSSKGDDASAGGGKCGEYNDCKKDDRGGSGGGGESQNKKIIDSLKGYKCAQDILKQMPNLNNDLARLLKDTFDTNDKVNITFKAKEGMGSVDGIKSFTEYKNGVFNTTIDLNADVLKYATQEYILVTMYHEFIHAYLSYQVSTLPYDQYTAKFPKVSEYEVKDSNGNIIKKYALIKDHKNYGSFIESLKNSIISFNPVITSSYAEALAKNGIVESLTENESKINRNERDTRNNEYKGKKCP